MKPYIFGERNGIHGQKLMLGICKKNEHDLLAETLEKVYG